jgi:hypothetical protein
MVVDGSADDAIDAGGPELARIGDKAWQMVDVAGGGEGSRDREEHHKASAKHGVAGGIGCAFGVDEFGSHGRYRTAAFNHICYAP